MVMISENHFSLLCGFFWEQFCAGVTVGLDYSDFFNFFGAWPLWVVFRLENWSAKIGF